MDASRPSLLCMFCNSHLRFMFDFVAFFRLWLITINFGPVVFSFAALFSLLHSKHMSQVAPSITISHAPLCSFMLQNKEVFFFLLYSLHSLLSGEIHFTGWNGAIQHANQILYCSQQLALASTEKCVIKTGSEGFHFWHCSKLTLTLEKWITQWSHWIDTQ